MYLITQYKNLHSLQLEGKSPANKLSQIVRFIICFYFIIVYSLLVYLYATQKYFIFISICLCSQMLNTKTINAKPQQVSISGKMEEIIHLYNEVK